MNEVRCDLFERRFFAREHPRCGIDAQAYLQPEVREGMHVVHVCGEVDICNAPSFDAALGAALAREAHHPVVLSFQHCGFIDCAALSVVIRYYERPLARLSLVAGERSPFGRLVTCANLERRLPVFRELDDAVRVASRVGGSTFAAVRQ